MTRLGMRFSSKYNITVRFVNCEILVYRGGGGVKSQYTYVGLIK